MRLSFRRNITLPAPARHPVQQSAGCFNSPPDSLPNILLPPCDLTGCSNSQLTHEHRPPCSLALPYETSDDGSTAVLPVAPAQWMAIAAHRTPLASAHREQGPVLISPPNKLRRSTTLLLECSKALQEIFSGCREIYETMVLMSCIFDRDRSPNMLRDMTVVT